MILQMRHELPFRIIVKNPPAGVFMKVQHGKFGLLDPSSVEGPSMSFDFHVSVDLSAETPNFLGPFAHGPKSERFLYVNSGSYAGQPGTQWNRRAKLPLGSISRADVEGVLSTGGSRIETTIEGTGRDGGPVCASIKGIEWSVAG